MKLKLPGMNLKSLSLSRIRIPRTVTVAVITVFIGLVGGAFFMLFAGSNPFVGYFFLFRGALMNIERLGNTLATATPLILTGLSVAFAFKTGLFNIGAAGQMLIGGICATLVGLTLGDSGMSKPILLLLMFLAAVAGGALWGFVPGILKALFNVHEVVATIMMNWIAFWIISSIVPLYSAGLIKTETERIPDVASLRVPWLTEVFDGSYINLGLFVAIFAVILIWVILDKTVLGYELKAAGFNRHAAEYGGMKVNRNIVLSMVIAGALAGTAGFLQYCGYSVNLQKGVLPAQGFNGIAVALLASSSPIGVLFSAFFMGMLQSGKGFMNAMTRIPPQIGDAIIAIILYFAATKILIERVLDTMEKKRAVRLELKTAAGEDA